MIKNPTQNPTASKKTASGKDVEVLYQKMGDRWFAFSVVGGEVYMGSITQEEIDRLEAGESRANAETGKTYGISGNS